MKRITNGKGIFRIIEDMAVVPKGWNILESVVEKPTEPAEPTEPELTKDDIMAKLDEVGIPYDGRRSLEDLKVVWEDYLKANEGD